MTDEEKTDLLERAKDIRRFLMILTFQMWLVVALILVIYLFLRHQASIQIYTK